MPTSLWFRSADLRRAVAMASVVLATGGLCLARSPVSEAHGLLAPAGAHEVRFSGPSAKGSIALSHGKVLAGGTTRVVAEVRLRADETRRGRVHAPTALVVVLDTSGSMEGEKIVEAKRAVRAMVEQMRDDDAIAFVRYDDRAVLEQPLGLLRDNRRALLARLDALRAGGGTNIASGLEAGLEAVRGGMGDDVRRVQRVVLVSDGLDAGRTQAENLANEGAERGVTVSSVGVGLDFDESYLGAIASRGHGNFGFASEGQKFEAFLRRELDEATATAIEDARVTLELPRGATFVSAEGASASSSGGDVELRFGSLFAGDERRAIVELDVRAGAEAASTLTLRPSASWMHGEGERARIAVDALGLVPTDRLAEVDASRDLTVLASATSVLASRRQMAAAAAFAKGDVAEATRLTRDNERALEGIRALAPAPARAALAKQLDAYKGMQDTFATTPPTTEAGKAAAKSAAAQEQSNTVRRTY